MRNVFTIFKNDFRALTRHFFAFLIILAILFLPALYAWFNIYAFWDPYGKTGDVSIAVVCNDRDYMDEDGKIINIGNQLVEELKQDEKIGFVFQNYNLVPVLNVYENIVLPIQLDGNAPDKAYVERIIETLGLEAKLQNLPNNLSGGQQQRVAIARALAAKPAIILADEPTGNLDSATSLDVMGLLKVTAQKFSQTIVMITHNEELAQMADRIIRIEDGRIVVRG